MRRVAVLFIALAACHDAAAPKPSVAPPPAAPAGPDLRDPYALLPADSDVIARVDFGELRKSPLWAKYKSDVLDLLAPSFASCDVDPLAELGLFTAGMPASDALGVFVIRGLDREKYLHCVRRPSPETQSTITVDGDFIIDTNKSGNVNMLTFVDPHTAVMQGSKGPTKQTLTQALTVGTPLRQDATLAAIDKALAPHAAVTLIFRPGRPAAEAMLAQKVGVPAKSMRATLHITDHVEAHVAVELASADDATAIVARMQPQLAQLKPFVDRFDERADGATIYMDVSMTEAQLQVIVGQIKRAMGPS